MNGDAVARIGEAVAADDLRGLRDALHETIGDLADSALRYLSEALAFLHHRHHVDWLQVGALEERLVIVLCHLEMMVCALGQLACAIRLMDAKH